MLMEWKQPIEINDLDACGSSVSDSKLMDIVQDVSAKDLDQIAIKHLDIKPHKLHDIRVAERENIQMRKFQILEHKSTRCLPKRPRSNRNTKCHTLSWLLTVAHMLVS